MNLGNRDDRGQGAIALLAVVVVLVVAVALLVRTTVLAQKIDGQSESIATSGEGINVATRSIIQLDQTNTYGRNILATAQPLEGLLNDTVNVAKSIDNTATAITNTALTVNSTARGINGTAGTILDTLRSINRGVETINRNVETTVGLVQAIRTDTQNIVTVVRGIDKNGACIDRGLNGTEDGHCK